MSAARMVDHDRTDAASGTLRDWRAGLDRAAGSARSARDRGVARAARTRVGNAVGTSTGRAGRRVKEMPILSLPSAVLEERRGVSHLSSLVADDPENPMPAIWLAEALQLLHRDLKIYLGLRTVWTWYAPLIAETAKVAHALGHGELVRPADAMLRRAYSLAMIRLRADRHDAEALHVVARVFLATGQHRGGVKPCTFAVLRSQPTATTQAEALFTLSRLHHRSGDIASARVAADQAIRQGCSLGWQVRADLVFHAEDQTSTTERITAYRRMLSHIDPDDEVAYRGFVRPKSGDICRAVLRDQSGKAANGYQWLADNYERLQDRTIQAVRQRRANKV
jgi:hypothetical protein